jgi:hypothetical protein
MFSLCVIASGHGSVMQFGSFNPCHPFAAGITWPLFTPQAVFAVVVFVVVWFPSVEIWGQHASLGHPHMNFDFAAIVVSGSESEVDQMLSVLHSCRPQFGCHRMGPSEVGMKHNGFGRVVHGSNLSFSCCIKMVNFNSDLKFWCGEDASA